MTGPVYWDMGQHTPSLSTPSSLFLEAAMNTQKIGMNAVVVDVLGVKGSCVLIGSFVTGYAELRIHTPGQAAPEILHLDMNKADLSALLTGRCGCRAAAGERPLLINPQGVPFPQEKYQSRS